MKVQETEGERRTSWSHLREVEKKETIIEKVKVLFKDNLEGSGSGYGRKEGGKKRWEHMVRVVLGRPFYPV